MTRKLKQKVVMLGNSCVGKSALIQKYVNNVFLTETEATVADDIRVKNIVIDNDVINLLVIS